MKLSDTLANLSQWRALERGSIIHMVKELEGKLDQQTKRADDAVARVKVNAGEYAQVRASLEGANLQLKLNADQIDILQGYLASARGRVGELETYSGDAAKTIDVQQVTIQNLRRLLAARNNEMVAICGNDIYILGVDPAVNQPDLQVEKIVAVIPPRVGVHHLSVHGAEIEIHVRN